MAKDRSFTDYVAAQFYNEIFRAVNQYVYAHRDRLELRTNVVAKISYAKLSDIYVKAVGVEDLPGTCISFQVILAADLEVHGVGRQDRESELCEQWFSLECSGDLAKGLQDFRIHSTKTYDQKIFHANPLSDALVPYLYSNQMESAATTFLKKYYPEALKTPMAIDTAELVKRMGLKIVMQQITEDFSVFGQVFFAAADSDVYDAETGEMVARHFDEGTIVVDPQTFLLRNLGCANNTIVHECVHWDRHRKAFELERLYNASATQIKCIVVGGIKKESSRSANDWMEWQANSLAPRIQMPLGPFKTKAQELIRKYQKLLNTTILVDVMESVIDELALFFCVSRHAAKIRMVDAGYEDAVGAFTFIDGQYVKPHAFKKGSLAKNQTYSISYQDAVIEAFMNPIIREKAQQGTYVYVDAHICLNDPRYITRDENGQTTLTEYARLHVDECCLAFTLKVKSVNKYGEQFYKECVLFRDVNSGLHFEAHFAPENSQSVEAKAAAMAAQNAEIIGLIGKLPRSFNESVKMVMKWAEVTVEGLAEEALLSSKTIQRMRNDAAYIPDLKTVVAVCIGMHLHPIISRHLIDAAGHTFRYTVDEHMMYDFFITSYYTHSIHECNALLRARGFSELSGQE